MRTVVGRQQLVDELGVAPELVRRVERARLILPLARTAGENEETYFDAGARHTVGRVVTLLAAGYAERDIAEVVGRVASEPGAATRRLPRILSVTELARRVGVGSTHIRGWLGVDALPLWAVDEHGEPFVEMEVEPLARALAALEVLGLGALVARIGPALRAPSGAPAQALRAELTQQLDQAAAALGALRTLVRRLAPKRRRRLLRRKKAATARVGVRGA